MTGDTTTRIFTGILAALAVGAALMAMQSLLAPIAFALYVVAIVWPLQARLQRHMAMGPAVALTIVVTLVVVSGIVSMVVWALTHVGQWLLANAGRFQVLYGQAHDWLEGHGFLIGSLVADTFDVRWMLRIVQELSSLLHSLGSFLVVMFLFVLLGLLEVPAFRSQVAALKQREAGTFMIVAGRDIAAKLQKHVKVRTLMSIATGVVVWAFTLASGLELAMAWGVIAFTMNYIPFIGPFVATFLPTVFALVQFESWQMAAFVFLCLNLIQFVSGSYLEPRIAGKTLSVSPFMVLFAIFLWSFLWGIAGIFLAVPFLIAALTACAHAPSLRWVSDLLSGQPAADDDRAA